MPFPDALSSVVDAPDGTETLGGSTPSHTVHTQALVDATNETQAALGVGVVGGHDTVAARLAETSAEGASGRLLGTALDQQSDAAVVVLGDSTGLVAYGDWPGEMGALIGSRWGQVKVLERQWNGTGYDAATTVANASATAALTIYNGSQGSADASYPLTRLAAMLPAEPALVVLSYGHNHGADTPAQLLADLETLVDAVRGEWSSVPVAVASQNPEYAPVATAAEHNLREAAKREWAASMGFGYVPAFEAFLAEADPASFLEADGVHPTAAGADLYAAAALQFVAAASRGPAPAAAGGGGAGYVYRDRLVATAGNTTLTLGASPVANSPLVWVNGAIKWPGTDYTISGDTITFGAALAGADVVAVQYHSAASSAAASTLTGGGVNILDDFNRTDSASSLGTTSTGGKVWSAHLGTWGIASNKAYVSNGPGGTTSLCSVDSEVSDCTVSVVATAVSGNPVAGFLLRSDATGANGYVVQTNLGIADEPKIFKATGGSYAIIATGASGTIAAGSVLSVILSGNTITVQDDGVTVVSVTDATYSSQTRHGIYTTAATGAAGLARFDDFTIQD